MKKIVSAIALVIILISAVSCAHSYDTPEEGIVGVWKYAYNGEIRDYITQLITDERLFVDLYYEFYEDGTGVTYLSTDKTKMEFTYIFDGETLTITNEDTTFDTPAKLDGDTLSVYDSSKDEYLDLQRQ